LQQFWDGEAIHKAVIYALSTSNPEEWASAMGREIILLSQSHRDLAESVVSICAEAKLDPRPFPGGPPCRAFLRAGISAALIPLESTGGTDPAFAQLWVFPTSLWPEAASAFKGRLAESGGFALLEQAGFTAALVTGSGNTARIEGRSWELGAALALKATQQGNGATALQLAKDWIVTGSVDRDQILPVGFRDKPRLASIANRRKWLVPAANQATISPGWEAVTAGRLYFARDIQSAWAQVTGEGFQGGGDLYWDKPPFAGVKEFHAFVSNAQGPILASFLLAQPKKIVLWLSKEMKEKGLILKEACETLRGTALKCVIDGIETRNVGHLELQAMRLQLLADPSIGEGGEVKSLFNITGGNLLMRIALLDIARIRPNLHLVYRPEGSTDLSFIAISHPHLLPIAGHLHVRGSHTERSAAWRELLNAALYKHPEDKWCFRLTHLGQKAMDVSPSEPYPPSMNLRSMELISAPNMNNDLTTTNWLLTIAAKGLQPYVLGSDKLREIVGATQLIEDFSSEVFAQDVLTATNLEGTVLTAAAGQTRIGFRDEEEARKAAALWPWIAHRLAPGMDVHVALASLEMGWVSALEECEKQIIKSRNCPAIRFPLAGPLQLRNQRTGQVASHMDREPDNEKVAVSSAAFAKRLRRKLLRDAPEVSSFFSDFGITADSLPESFEEIAAGEAGDRSYLALLHADGNGFGQLLIKLGDEISNKLHWPKEQAIPFFQELSNAIREIGAGAVKKAVSALGDRLVNRNGKSAILPIVFAGDDLTVVLRSGIAWDFATAFLKAFEDESAEKLKKLGENPAYEGIAGIFPKSFTAGAAIIYCKQSYPFAAAYKLCESLISSKAKGEEVKFADGTARSAIAFHRISASTAPTNFREILEDELSCADGGHAAEGEMLYLCGAPYFLEGAGHTVSNFELLVDALGRYPAGARRQLLSDLRTNRADASARLERMLKIGEAARNSIPRKSLESALESLHGEKKALWSPPSGENKGLRSCIGDALSLIEMSRNLE